MTNSRFLFGAATSSHQVEGNNIANDWWAAEQAGDVKYPSGDACQHLERYEEDIQLIKQLGHNAYRFSIEWSRLQPKEDQWNEGAFDQYEKILQKLRLEGIEPVVTLHHFTNPQWFASRGGWEKKENLDYFYQYVSRVVERFGKYVQVWITINEPMVYLYHGYFEGIWPPGKKSLPLALDVLRNLINAHNQAYAIIHELSSSHGFAKPRVSIAKHVLFFTAFREQEWMDHVSTWLRHWFFNELFINAVQTGFLFFPGMFCESLGTQGCLDFLGLNYYARDRIRFETFKGTGILGEKASREELKSRNLEWNQLDWEVSPQGLFTLLKQFKKYKLPIMILENGICTLDDEQRSKFIKRHIQAVCEAQHAEVPVEGYFYWSLLDNFEWAEGYSPRFGLIEIEDKTYRRKVRPSAQVLSESCRKLLV